MKKITIQEVDYLSETDEDIFFAWLDKIPAIVKKYGESNNLYLHIDQKKLNETGLRELLALFYRYGIDMKQLKVFLNENNKSWFFENKDAFWHERVFVTEAYIEPTENFPRTSPFIYEELHELSLHYLKYFKFNNSSTTFKITMDKTIQPRGK